MKSFIIDSPQGAAHACPAPSRRLATLPLQLQEARTLPQGPTHGLLPVLPQYAAPHPPAGPGRVDQGGPRQAWHLLRPHLHPVLPEGHRGRRRCHQQPLTLQDNFFYTSMV